MLTLRLLRATAQIQAERLRAEFGRSQGLGFGDSKLGA